MVAKAQAEIFGYINSYDNTRSGQKKYRITGQEKAVKLWFPMSQLHFNRKVRKIIREKIKEE